MALLRWKNNRSAGRRRNRHRAVALAAGAQALEARRLFSVAPGADLDLESEDGSGCPVCGSGGCSEHMGDDGTVLVKCLYKASRTPPSLPVAPMLPVAPLVDTFKLHSLPSATKKIYLDFDGHVTAGTAWQRGASFNTPAFSLDADYATFSESERRAIQEVWARVAEDFYPFDVDVTTEQPPLDDLRKAGQGDERWGMRVVIGGRGEWMAGAAGVAYLNSFNWDSDTPCFVFADQSWKTNLNFMASCVSHEVGHTFGLRHDGFRGAEYYAGRGTGETGWGPIMGNPGFVNLTQWSKGEYGGSTNREDDLAIITTRNGFGYRADDHGGTLTTATVAPSADFEISGFVGAGGDVDMFRFTTTGQFQASVSPISVGTNLDILASLLDATGQVVLTSNPVDKVGASFTTTVAAGTYYLAVRGTGMGDINSTGYTAYGSLGQYTVKVGAPSGPTPSLSIADARVVEGNTGTTVVEVSVSLSVAAQGAVTVAYATADGTATTADADYGAASGTVTFAAGETRKTVVIQVKSDTRQELDESFFVRLSNPSGAVIGDGEATVTIANDDAAPPPGQPVLSIADVVITEGQAGQKKATFTVSLSTPATQTVSFVYRTVDGTAKADDQDYLSQSGGFSLNRGASSVAVSVTILGDTKNEPDETFSVVLANPSGAVIGRGEAVCTIQNDDATDPPPPTATLSVADATIQEGESGISYADFTVSLSAAATEMVSVRYATADRVATVFDRDYVAASGSLVFAPGETSKTVRVGVVGDTRREPDETFAFVLSSAAGAAIARQAGVCTIVNDDSADGTTVSVADARVTEGHFGNRQLSFVVSLSSAAVGPVSVKFRTAAGSATPGSDYADAVGEVRFARGGVRQTVNIWVRGDRVVEETETLSLELFGVTGAAVGRALAVGTIVNDDLPAVRAAVQAAAWAELGAVSALPKPSARRPVLR